MSNAAICLECGGSFLRRRAHQIFCKPGCARKYNGRKYRAQLSQLREQAQTAEVTDEESWDLFLGRYWPQGRDRKNVGTTRWHDLRMAFGAGWSARGRNMKKAGG